MPPITSDHSVLTSGSQTEVKLPARFLWGVSTAAHQVEGGNLNNQWWAWEAAGRVKSKDCCGNACNWWLQAERDFDLARDLGLNAMRLSLEWSRIEPRQNVWDTAAIHRYRQMLQGLRERGIRPFVTLHHFTNPLWFEHKGAFLDFEAPQLFERFTRRVISEFGDLCEDWVTFNEPNVYAALGYVVGEFPPGKRGDFVSAIRALSGMGRAHALAYRAIHELQPSAQVGWAHNYVVFHPAADSKLDRGIVRLVHELFNESFLRLVDRGSLAFPLHLLDGDTGNVQGTYDFVGLNVYSRFRVAFDLNFASQLFARIFVSEDAPQGDKGVENPYGEVYPAAIRAAVERVAPLGKPIYILENGVPDAADRIRPWLLMNVLREIHSLVAENHDLRGYFHWTLTDNFEWSEGWGLRFGLFSLDPTTQERKPRRSAELYKRIVQQNGLSPDLAREYEHPLAHATRNS
ncbi:MAG TPA: family 1 glycosylhydrolase [Terriglobales bacterium]|nr:family 1 glycosylhydrolase [Terriglobales bacterium]